MYKIKTTKLNKGFTLIELLVVISIIGLLSSIVLASLTEARDRANVTKTVSEMISLKNAIEMYRLDNNGEVPGHEFDTGFGVFTSDGYSYFPPPYDFEKNHDNVNTFLSTTLVDGGYISKIPHSPNFHIDNDPDEADRNTYAFGYAKPNNGHTVGPNNFYWYCGEKLVDNYVIFFHVPNIKLDLPLAKYTFDGGTTFRDYHTGSTGIDNTYCVSN